MRPSPLHLRVSFQSGAAGHLEFGVVRIREGLASRAAGVAFSRRGDCAIGILCGARTPRLLERMEAVAKGSRWERSPEPDCPDVLRLQGPDTELLIVFAGRAGILCQLDAPATLLSCLPSITSLEGFRREALPAFGKEWMSSNCHRQKNDEMGSNHAAGSECFRCARAIPFHPLSDAALFSAGRPGDNRAPRCDWENTTFFSAVGRRVLEI